MMLSIFVIVGLAAACIALPAAEDVSQPCICTMDYTPVCGMDGKTYSNKCAMDCDGIQLNYVGECKKMCICPRIYSPVCGQDGKTYSNSCEMNCNGVAFFQDGPCTAVAASPIQKRADLCICPFNYAPVCGVDNKTYGNKCALDCAHVTLKSDGACTTV